MISGLSSQARRDRIRALLRSTLCYSALAISRLLAFKEQSALSSPPPVSCLPGDLLEASWMSLDLSSSLPVKQAGSSLNQRLGSRQRCRLHRRDGRRKHA